MAFKWHPSVPSTAGCYTQVRLLPSSIICKGKCRVRGNLQALIFVAQAGGKFWYGHSTATFVSFPTLWRAYSNRPALPSVYRLIANTQPSSRSSNNFIRANFKRNCDEIASFINIVSKQWTRYMNSYMHVGENRLVYHPMRKIKKRKILAAFGLH